MFYMLNYKMQVMRGRDQDSRSNSEALSTSVCTTTTTFSRILSSTGMLMALNRAPELAVHVRGARNNGLSELEIREAILHATTYCGVPAGVDAMKTAEKVLNEMAERGEMPRELGNKSEKA
jgi:4-carboxymuconolactone decarboxylase